MLEGRGSAGEEGVIEDENDQNAIYTYRDLSKDNKLNTHLKKNKQERKDKIEL